MLFKIITITDPGNNLLVLIEGLFITENVCIGLWFHQLNKDNGRTGIKPLTLDYSFRLKSKLFTYQAAYCTKTALRKVNEPELAWDDQR